MTICASTRAESLSVAVRPGQVASGEEVGGGFEYAQGCGGAGDGDGVVNGDPIGPVNSEVGALLYIPCAGMASAKVKSSAAATRRVRT